MLFNSIVVSSVLLALSAHANAHATINPPLGVAPGQKATRNDAQRPSNGKECGKASPATIDASQIVQATGANGAFKVTGQSFNGAQDGSTFVTMTVDTTGKGTGFKAIGSVTTNGNKAPKGAETADITAQLGAGTKCTGGKTGNVCLVAFKTQGGFGNCVAVQLGAAGAGAAAAPPAGAGANAAGGAAPPAGAGAAPPAVDAAAPPATGGATPPAADAAGGAATPPAGAAPKKAGGQGKKQGGKKGKGGKGGKKGKGGAAKPAGGAKPAAGGAAIATSNAKGGPPFDPAGVKNVGNGKAQQFITGQCLSGADCASGCCAGPSGICSGPGAATQVGKTGCGFKAKRELALPGGRRAVLDDLLV